MTIGGSIALMVIGAVLRWAINWSPSLVNLRLVGLILIIGGAIGLIISIAYLASRRSRRPMTPPAPPPADGYDGYEEHRYVDREGRYTDRRY